MTITAPRPGAGKDVVPQTPPALENLELTALSNTEWRVFDARFPAENALGLLGFIEEKDGGFEVLQIGAPGRTFRFDTLEAALTHFVRQPVSR